MVCEWFIYKEMELRYWLVHGNVKKKNKKQKNKKQVFIGNLRIMIKSADLKQVFVLNLSGLPCIPADV